ncbi:hypothetical protein SASPL_105884 [Salvia splendens]|uniref:UV-stimulated scaffold protein A C-terminal domain-containing protein n=1 Tax=Salvia splendens TaxID=180675 RepID=A0A8X8YM85_SALSN|nr:hypothetical protein SASPL_105884 [Salvia splendens]
MEWYDSLLDVISNFCFVSCDVELVVFVFEIDFGVLRTAFLENALHVFSEHLYGIFHFSVLIVDELFHALGAFQEVGFSESNKDPVPSVLLAEATVLNWESSRIVGDQMRMSWLTKMGLDVEIHWGRVDQDACSYTSQENCRTEEKPLKVQLCRAPLKNDALCQRKDLKVCPFHGPNIPRWRKSNQLKRLSAKTSQKNLVQCRV